MGSLDISTENILDSLAELLEVFKELHNYKQDNLNQIETLNKHITEKNSIIESLRIDYGVLKDEQTSLLAEKSDYSNKNKDNEIKLKDLKQIKDEELNLRVKNEELHIEIDKLTKYAESLNTNLKEQEEKNKELNISLSEKCELLKKSDTMYQSKESELNKLIQEFDLLKTKNSD